MPRHLIGSLSLTLALALFACAPAKPPVTAPVPTAAATTSPVAPAAVGAVITGQVSVPASLLSARGSIISGGGGNVISTNAGAIISGGGGNLHGDRQLLAVTEAPVAGVTVFLADAAGEPIPGLGSVKTDASGQYTFKGVPPDFTFVVAAEAKTDDGKKAVFQTLTRSGKLGATANVSPASTLVTASVVEGLKGDLGGFNPAAFKTATETTATNLAPDKLPDFTNRGDILTKMNRLISEVTALRASLDQVKADLQDIRGTLEDLKKQLAERDASRPAPVVSAPAPGESPRAEASREPVAPVSQAPGATPAPRESAAPRPTPSMTAPASPPPTGTQPPPQGCGADFRTHYFRLRLADGGAYDFSRHTVLFKIPAEGPGGGTVVTRANVPDAHGGFVLCIPEDKRHDIQVLTPLNTQVGGQLKGFVVMLNGTDSPDRPIVLSIPR